MVNRVFAKIYSTDGVYSHTLCLDMWDEHGNMFDYSRSLDYNSEVSVQLLKKKVYYTKVWVDVIYLLGGIDQIAGYYLLLPDNLESGFSMIRCAHPPEGYLRVLKVINCRMMIIPTVTKQMDLGSNLDQNPKLTYDNYCKDLQV